MDRIHELTENEQVSIVKAHLDASIGEEHEDLSEKRELLREAYEGMPYGYGTEQKGFSRVVDWVVFQTVENALPDLLQMFLAANRLAEFVPQPGEDEEAVKLEEAAVNWYIMEKCNGFSLLLHTLRDAAINPIAYTKTCVLPDMRQPVKELEGLSHEEALYLTEGGDKSLAVLHVEQMEDGTYMVRVRKADGDKVTNKLIPPDQIRVGDKATSADPDEVPWICHDNPTTRGELMAQGYPQELVEKLPADGGYLREGEEAESRRDRTGASDLLTSNTGTWADEEVVVHEWYGHIDADGDGFSEFRRIDICGEFLLLSEYATDQPFSAFCCYPLPHVHSAISLAEVAEERQRIETQTTRHMLDNMQRTNRPRTFAGAGVNLDQLMTFMPFGVVDVGGSVEQVKTEAIQPAVRDMIPFQEHSEARREGFTGVSKHTQGLDPDVLAQSTFGAYNAALSRAAMRLLLVARTLGEMSGVRSLVLKTHAALRETGQLLQVPVGQDQWARVDPSRWTERDNVVVRVGVGHGDDMQAQATARIILELQEMALEHGMTDKGRMFTAVSDLLASLHKYEAERYFVDPDSDEGKALAEQSAKAEAEEKQGMQAMIMAQLEEGQQKHEREMAKMFQDMQQFMSEQSRKMLEMELKYNVDLPGGLPGTVTPLRSAAA